MEPHGERPEKLVDVSKLEVCSDDRSLGRRSAADNRRLEAAVRNLFKGRVS